MKKFIGIGFTTLLSISFFGCGASKVKAQNEHPFKVVEATYTSKIGEQPDLAVTSLKITTTKTELQLDSVYFRNHIVHLVREESVENSVFTGSFTTSNLPHDYILHGDPKQEFGNKPPIETSKKTFELCKNEAIVSYFYKDKTHYYKILDVKEMELKD